MKVAIVHYWLVGMRGGESVLEAFCEMFPAADIYTHVYVPDRISETIKKHDIYPTYISKLPFATTQYQKYLPFMPSALAELDLTEYDLVISSESGPAKGVVTSPYARHICYVHSPMRYIWDQYHVYKKNSGFLSRLFLRLLAGRMRRWDVQSSNGVDIFVANSQYVSRRIKKYYRRDSEVIFPPVDVDSFSPAPMDEVGDYYLWIGELVPYKRADLAIEAFNKNRKPLLVIGDGPSRIKLESIASGNIEFLGRVATDCLRHHAARCRALIFPGVEDFGIVPVEVLASGRPVIAYGKGGVTDSVIDGENGILYAESSSGGLNDAITRFEASSILSADPVNLANSVAKFNKSIFQNQVLSLVESS